MYVFTSSDFLIISTACLRFPFTVTERHPKIVFGQSMHRRHLTTKLRDKINKLHCKIFTNKSKTIQSWYTMHLSKIYKNCFKGEVSGPDIIQELTLCYFSVFSNTWLCKKSSPCPSDIMWCLHSTVTAISETFPIRDAGCKMVHSGCRDGLKSNSRSHPMKSSTASSPRDLTWPSRPSRDASPYESSPRDISERCLHISSVWKIHTDGKRTKRHIKNQASLSNEKRKKSRCVYELCARGGEGQDMLDRSAHLKAHPSTGENTQQKSAPHGLERGCLSCPFVKAKDELVNS